MTNQQMGNEPSFPGFVEHRGNYALVPREFFEVVRNESPVVSTFVAAVIEQTADGGWWEASFDEIGRAAGIRSKASVTKAVLLARSNGYVIRRDGESAFCYRLREHGEPIDDNTAD